MINNTSGKVAVSTVTSTELEYLSGVTSAIQTQISGKQNTLTAGTGISIVGNTISATGGGGDGSSQWTTAGDTVTIYYASGTVGIGTNAPNTSYKLDVLGDQFVTGTIRATGNIIASFSDTRLKEIVSPIKDPIEKIMQIDTFTYRANELAKSFNLDDHRIHVGLSAQSVKEVLPEVVTLAPFDSSNINNTTISKSGEEYLTVSYERLVPVLIECIKTLTKRIDSLEARLPKSE